MLTKEQLRDVAPLIRRLPADRAGKAGRREAKALALTLVGRFGLPTSAKQVNAVCRQIYRVWHGCRDEVEHEPGAGTDGPIPEPIASDAMYLNPSFGRDGPRPLWRRSDARRVIRKPSLFS